MKTKRVIVRLDVKNEALVKGIHLEGLRVLGKPELFAKHYYEDGVDELLFMDVVASLYGRNGLVELVRTTAENIFVPLTVGGGVRNANDVRTLLHSGADKIVINTAAVKSPDLVKELADTFGSSTIAVSIETIKDSAGNYMAYNDNGREPTGLNAIEWAQQVQSLGAGEIILTSVDREGTGKGMDLDLIRMVQAEVTIPVVAHGGVGRAEDMVTAFEQTEVDAICAASVYHYHTITRMDTQALSVRGNTSFVNSGSIKKNLFPLSVSTAKDLLRRNGVNVR
jgi:cyclase